MMAKRVAAAAKMRSAHDALERADLLLHDGPQPDAADLYKIVGLLMRLVAILQPVVETTKQRVEILATENKLRDDDGLDPIVRVGTCVDSLHQMNDHLHSAIREASRAWSAIGHLGVIPPALVASAEQSEE